MMREITSKGDINILVGFIATCTLFWIVYVYTPSLFESIIIAFDVYRILSESSRLNPSFINYRIFYYKRGVMPLKLTVKIITEFTYAFRSS